eukprot:scaffold1533_cov388-Prasinococcus_capsulatus_cf.AAC.9
MVGATSTHWECCRRFPLLVSEEVPADHIGAAGALAKHGDTARPSLRSPSSVAEEKTQVVSRSLQTRCALLPDEHPSSREAVLRTAGGKDQSTPVPGIPNPTSYSASPNPLTRLHRPRLGCVGSPLRLLMHVSTCCADTHTCAPLPRRRGPRRQTWGIEMQFRGIGRARRTAFAFVSDEDNACLHH